MLQGLLGNKNRERILLFLFVNERCYGNQLQTLLNVPLSPLQHALGKLEQEGVLESHFEKKVKVYEFNLSYPFYKELQQLLKKAYTLLPSSEKRSYCFVHKPRLSLIEDGKRALSRRKELFAFWGKLPTLKKLNLSIKESGGLLLREGRADVVVRQLQPNSLLFQEKGHWLDQQGLEGAFTNAFRWTYDKEADLITLEHLRYGIDHPVFLFHLTSKEKGVLEPIDAHLCAEDTYLGRILWDQEKLLFNWRIIGTSKNTHLIYEYV